MNLTYSSLFNKSWDGIKDQIPLVAGLTLVYMMGAAALSFIPFVGGMLSSPLTAGYMVCLLKIRRKEDIGYQDVFWGFTDLNRLAQLLIASVLVSFLTILGLLLLIVPGVWFMVAAQLATAYIVLTNADGITAIKKSMAATKGHWWKMFGLVFVICLLVLAGAVCFLIGVLVTIPMATLMVLTAAEELKPQAELALGGGSGGAGAGTTSGSSVLTVNPS